MSSRAGRGRLDSDASRAGASGDAVLRVFAASVFLVSSCATAPQADRPGTAAVVAAAAEAEAATARLVAEGFAGSVLVACGDEVLFERDYGVDDPRGREPSYWLASISKQFTAAAILQLAERGRLKLEDPLSGYFTDVPADKAGITVSQLLSHQSGLPQAYAADGIADRAEAVRAVLAGELASAPGTEFNYSNDNYTLLAIIVELVSGQSFEDYERTNIFAPAGLRHMGFWPDAGDDHVPGMLRQLDGPTLRASWGFKGGVGMRASVRDLHRWTRALDSGRVLAPESVRALYGPATQTSSGLGVGYGWFWSDLPDGRWLWTRGSEDFGPNVIVYRRFGTGLVIIAATNAGPAEAAGPGWSRRVRDALMPIYGVESCR